MDRTNFEQWKGKEVARLLALVETERRYYQEIVATLPVAIAVLAGDRSIVLANRAFRQMLGVSAQEVRRKPIEQILASEKLIEEIRAVHLDSGAERYGNGILIEVTGKLLRIEVRPIRSWDEDMELETLLAIQDLSTDGSDEIAEAAPPAPAPLPPFPTSELPAIIWQADANTLRFTAVSGSLGVRSEEWLGTEGFFESRIYADDREATMDLYRSILKQGGEASAEFRTPAPSGDIQWCRESVVVAPPSGETQTSEEPRKIYGVLTFIGERVRMQRQIDVASRRAALTGVSARLAHDLNNPLMLIAGYAEEMLHAFSEGDSRREDVQQIVKATERIAELTGHLTRFTQPDAPRAESVDVAGAVQRLQPKMAAICGSSVAIHIDAPSSVWGFADARALEELLLTLAGAAHSGAGCTELRVTCDHATIAEQIPEATLAAGTYARVTIQGNGAGAVGIKRVSLFESILAKSADNVQGESLSHAYALAQAWGGDLAYAADASRSTFILYLRPSEPVTTMPPVILVNEPPVPAPLILVVDDEPGIRALVAKILRREKYDVIEASAAGEAGTVADAQSRPVELLVTDIMLPDHPGTQLAELMRKRIPALKVLYMSGFTENEQARAGQIPPGAKFLQKPFTLNALVAKVRESFEEA